MLSKIKNEYFIFFISFLIYFPIILWGGYFLDDNYRSIHAYYAWTGDYRPIADWIYYLLGLSTDFIDTSPLNYIIQFFLVSYFIIFFTRKIQEIFKFEDNLKNYISISISFLFLSPFFMQNLYFRYDSLIMVLSVIIACVPFFFNNKKIDLLCCVLVFFTYQSSIVGYMCIVILKIIAMSLKNENRIIIYKEAGKSIAVFLLAVVVFFLTARLLISPNDYAKNHTSLITSFDMLIENIHFSLDILAFSSSLLDYTLIIFSLIIGMVFIFKTICDNLNICRLDKLVILIGIIFVFLICLLNMNILLAKPRLYPRTYIGFGFVVFLTGFCLTLLIATKDQILKKYVCFYKFLLIGIFVMFLNIFYAGYNYIKETEKYSENLINNINYDLSTLGQNHYKSIMAYGVINYPLRAQVLANRYPILMQIFYNKMDLKKHRIFYDILVNSGYDFDVIKYRSLSNINSYNKNLTENPVIVRSDYNIVINGENELYIYFKNKGVIVRSPSKDNRLD